MHIIANVDFSNQLKKGESHELPETDARMLIAAGLARAAEAPLAPAVPSASPESTTPRRRQYVRRDLQADASS